MEERKEGYCGKDFMKDLQFLRDKRESIVLLLSDHLVEIADFCVQKDLDDFYPTYVEGLIGTIMSFTILEEDIELFLSKVTKVYHRKKQLVDETLNLTEELYR